jgi:hypothetical protein
LASKQQRAGTKGIRSDDREEYTRPTLKEFGQVGALTQAGTGGAVEAGNEKPMMGMGGDFSKRL